MSAWWLLVLRAGGGDEPHIWLQRRPPRGIWAGLHCTPVLASEAEALSALPPGCGLESVVALEPVAHSLTHRELRLHPLLVDVPASEVSGDGQWVALSGLSAVGLPAPVRVLLDRLPD